MTRSRLVQLGILAILISVCVTMSVGRRMPFSTDDMMNMYRAWTMSPLDMLSAHVIFTPPGYRPFGELIYRLIYWIAGFHSQPLHWIVWGMLIANFWVAYRFFRSLGAGGEAGLLAVLILSIHAALIYLSYNAGTLYDTFCFTFYASALTIYFRSRSRGPLGARSLVAFCVLLILALDSKEMAVSLPVVLLAWELLFHPPDSWRWPVKDGRGVLASGVIALLFVVMALTGTGPETGAEGYTPVLSWAHWAHTTNHYICLALYGDGAFTGMESALVYAAAFGIALALRSRLLLFCALWFPITLLPISFIPDRNGYVLYIPLLGWSLYAATLLVKARDALLRALGRNHAPDWARALLFSIVAVGLLAANRFTIPPREKMDESPVERTARQFSKMLPHLKGPTRLLFVTDPYRPSGYGLLFTLGLLYHDDSIEVHRLKGDDAQHPPLDQLPTYDHIFAYYRGRYVELDNSNSAQAVQFRLLRGQKIGEHFSVTDEYFEPYIVKDVLDGDGPWRWTGAEPELRFHLDSTVRRSLFVKFAVPEVALKAARPKSVIFFVNGHELARRSYAQEVTEMFSQPVPDNWLSTDGFTSVRMLIENPYVLPEDQSRLGVLVFEAGFK